MSTSFFSSPAPLRRRPVSRGATCYETEVALHGLHQTISARFTELHQWNFTTHLLDSLGDNVTRPTDTGCKAKVHVLTAQGREAVELDLPIRKSGSFRDPTAPRHRGVSTSREAYERSKQGHAALRLQILKYLYSLS